MSNYTVTFTNANGITINFDDVNAGHALLGPVVDTHMPGVQHTSKPAFGEQGAVRIHTRIDVREVTVPFAVFGTQGTTFHSRMRTITSILDPTIGDGTLTVARNGVGRSLTCRFQDGFGGELHPNDSGPTDWWEGAITFIAFDPYWLDEDWNETEFRAAGNTAFFTQPFLPLNRLNVGSTFANLNVSVAGDAPAWPVWTVTGPATNPKITDLTTGKKLDFSDYSGVALADSSETLSVDTSPGVKSATRYYGGTAYNVFSALTSDSSLFSLAPGNHTIRFAATSPAGSTRLLVQYKQRYLAP